MKQILERLTSLLAYVAAISTIIIILVTSIDLNSFNKDFYASEYKKLNTSQSLGMTDKDLNKATTTILDYLRDNRKNINVQISIKGTETDAFNAKEASHMADVKRLYHVAIVVRNVALLALIGSILYLCIRLKKGAFTLLSINYMKTAVLFAVFLIMMAAWAIADFDAFWTSFHRIFFRNDLWLLDPATDLMINLFPAQFFGNLIVRIITGFLVTYSILFLISYLYLRKQLHKLHDEIHYEL